jgi:shikimate kinase
MLLDELFEDLTSKTIKAIWQRKGNKIFRVYENALSKTEVQVKVKNTKNVK